MVTDTLPKELTYVSTTVAVSNVTLASSDYAITTKNNADGTTAVEVRFTATGLAKLGANRSETVTVTINTKANTVGEIVNTANIYTDKSSIDAYDDCDGCIPPDNPPTPTNPVETKWGSVIVQKTDASGAPLPGAQFQVFTSLTDAKAQTNPVAVDGTTTWGPTGTNGQVTISGLRYSNWADGAAVNPGDPGYIQYYLVETVAPTGYELQAEPIPFTVTSDATSVSFQVTDVPTNAGFPLPFTGGTGTTVLYVAGLIILVGGAVTGVAIHRRKAAGGSAG